MSFFATDKPDLSEATRLTLDVFGDGDEADI